MIGRIAESLYWLGRYMERIENHARLIDVAYHMQANHMGQDLHPWTELIDTFGVPNELLLKNPIDSESNVMQLLVFSRDYSNSIISCLVSARNDTQSVRERVPSELWEAINGFYLWMKDETAQAMLHYPHSFFQKIKEQTALYQGIIESTMLRGQEWHILESGKYIERAENTLRILKVIISEHKRTVDFDNCLALLKSVSGFEAYRKCQTSPLTIERMIEFMILNAIFPRSTRFALNHLNNHLHSLFHANIAASKTIQRVMRLTGRMHAQLAYMEIPEIIESGIISFLIEEISVCNTIGQAIETIFNTKEVSVLPF